MVRLIKTTAVFVALLFSAQGVQAATAPTDITENFGSLTTGTYDSASSDTTVSYALPNDDPAVNWYQFTLENLIGLATVTLNTELLYVEYPYTGNFNVSTETIDTILGLYADDADGTLLAENDACGGDSTPIIRYSCITYDLAAGTYIVGVNDAQFMSDDTPFLDGWMLEGREYSDESYTALRIDVDGVFDSPSPVPVPAAVWLFGTALIGFVGMSRRTSVKS